MKKIHLLFSFLAMLAMLFAHDASAQISIQTTNLTVVYNNGQSDSHFENVSKFFFDDDYLMIDQSGIESAISLSTVKHLKLEAVTTAIEELTDFDQHSVLIYPNPTNDKLFFSTAQEREVLVSLYSMNGQLLKRLQMNTSASLDVSFLSKGVYMLSVDDKVFKFSKL